MFELVYHSVSPNNPDKDDLMLIQKISEDSNSTIGVTGCLFYHNNDFVGILEGNEEIVKQVFSKIAHDNRHKNISILAEGSIGERMFDKWNMISVMESNDPSATADHSLLVENVLGLTRLSEKTNFGSKVFWERVEEIIVDHKTKTDSQNLAGQTDLF